MTAEQIDFNKQADEWWAANQQNAGMREAYLAGVKAGLDAASDIVYTKSKKMLRDAHRKENWILIWNPSAWLRRPIWEEMAKTCYDIDHLTVLTKGE